MGDKSPKSNRKSQKQNKKKKAAQQAANLKKQTVDVQPAAGKGKK